MNKSSSTRSFINSKKKKIPSTNQSTTHKKKKKPPSLKERVTFFAGDTCRYEVVRACAASMSWRLLGESASPLARSSVNIYWVDTASIQEYTRSLEPWQRINHFPGMPDIARKSRLAQNLDFMRRKFPGEFTFYPRSFVLPHEVSLFRDQFDKETGKSKKTFIIKPDAGCQGRGIYLAKHIDQVDTMNSCVAQHYIANVSPPPSRSA